MKMSWGVVSVLILCLTQANAGVVTLTGTNQVEETYLRYAPSGVDAACNYGGLTYVMVGQLTADVKTHTLMRFTDLSEVLNQNITAATLRLYSEDFAEKQTGDVTINIYAVSSANTDWQEGDGNGDFSTAGWSSWNFRNRDPSGNIEWTGGRTGCGTAGTDYITNLVGSAVVPTGTLGYVEFDLDVSVIQSWIDDADQNHGLLLTAPDAVAGDIVFLHSSEAIANTPELVLETVPKTAWQTSFSGTNQIEDVYLRYDANSIVAQSSNYGGLNFMMVGQLNADIKANLLMRFSGLSALEGQTVTNVALRLYSNDFSGQQTADVTVNVYEVAAVNSSWQEGDGNGDFSTDGWSSWRFVNRDSVGGNVQWAGGETGCGTSGTDYVTNLVGSAVVSDGVAEYVEFSLDTDVVQNWIDNPSQNYGLLLIAEGASAGQIVFFNSSESTSGNVPKLIVDTVLVATTYDNWAIVNGLSGSDALNTADPDADGMDNLLEYALGGNPNTDDAVTVQPSLSVIASAGTNQIEYVYNRRVDAASRGLDYGVLLNTDLVLGTWTNIGTSAETGTAAVDSDFEVVTNHIPVVESQKFISLEVTEN